MHSSETPQRRSTAGSSGSTATTATPALPALPSLGDSNRRHVLYQTLSLCARCCFIDHCATLESKDWRQASVYALRDRLLLHIQCPIHPDATPLHRAHSHKSLMPHDADESDQRTSNEDSEPSIESDVSKQFSRQDIELCSSLHWLRTQQQLYPQPQALNLPLLATPAALQPRQPTAFLSKLDYSDPAFKHRPLMLELTLCHDKNLMSLDRVKRQLDAMSRHYAKGSHFVVRLCGGLLVSHAQLVEFNALCRQIAAHCAEDKSCLNGCPLLIDLSSERLVDLADLKDTCLLQSFCFPFLRFHVRRGDESLFVSECTRVIQSIQGINDCQLLVSISCDGVASSSSQQRNTESPDFGALLRFLHSDVCATLIRTCIFERQRSPAQILAALLEQQAQLAYASSSDSSQTRRTSMQQYMDASDEQQQQQQQQGSQRSTPRQSGSGSMSAGSCGQTIDPISFMSAISSSTDGALQSSDWIPLYAVGAVLTPLLASLGCGSFHLSPPLLDGFATCQITIGPFKEQLVTRLWHVPALYRELLPIVQRLVPGAPLGLQQAQILTRALRRHFIAGDRAFSSQIGDLWQFVASRDATRQALIAQFVRQMRVFVLHTPSDFASVDLVRRVNCAVVQPCPTSDDRFVSPSTQCI